MKIVKELSQIFFFSERKIFNWIKTSPIRYKVYEIEKRNGGKRTIAQPEKYSKLLQQSVIKNQLSGLPIHDCAKAYKKDIGIKDNAEMHKENQYLLKMDFKLLDNEFSNTKISSYCFSMLNQIIWHNRMEKNF